MSDDEDRRRDEDFRTLAAIVGRLARVGADGITDDDTDWLSKYSSKPLDLVPGSEEQTI